MHSQLITKEYNNNLVTFDLSSDMLISLTDMAKANGKRVNDWLRLQSTNDYLNEYSSSTGNPVDGIIVVKQGGNGGGTWANQDIALEFARWLSPKFSIWCNIQIKELLTKGTVTLAPMTYKEALLALIAKEEELEAKQLALDTAIRTKAEIGTRREATAMNTASQLRKELDKAKEFATIKRMELATKRKFNWRLLKDYSMEHDLPINEVFDANYGTVKSYHEYAWDGVYQLDISRIS